MIINTNSSFPLVTQTITPISPTPLPTKKCSKCKEVKSLNDFHKAKCYKDGVGYYCKLCSKKSILEYKKKHIFIKLCPSCNKEMIYNRRGEFNRSVKLNRKCCSCCQKGKKRSEETRKKIGNGHIGKKRSEETRKKMSESQIKYLQSDKSKIIKEWPIIMPSGKIIHVHGYERLAIPYLLSQGIKEDDLICGVFEVNPIPYMWENSIHNYIPDIYIKSLNTMVEVKSEYTFLRYFLQNKEKSRATVAAGYNFRLIIFNNNHEIVLDKIKYSYYNE